MSEKYLQVSQSILNRVAAERARQRKLLNEGKILFNCDSPVADANRKLRVLVEEVGEVAEALDAFDYPNPTKRLAAIKDHLQDELVQVAAVAIAWLECFETPNQK
jgi:hypothetical protein